ncbi:MAG: hypothetical protein VKO26_04955, partial [Cyanobacteriota bacterium]|nr:hypothetical protein [Cyanobacteriota bacterium]
MRAATGLALLFLGAFGFDQSAALAKDALGPPITLTEAREAETRERETREAEAREALAEASPPPEATPAEPKGVLIVQLPPLPAAAAVVATVAGPPASASLA